METEREKLINENLLKLKFRVQELRLEKVWKQFIENGFEPIMIKGWVASSKYPNPEERLYVDIDLIFSSQDFGRAYDFLQANTFDLSIDLHKEARHLDSLGYKELYANSILKPCGETLIRVPCEEDHLRILCVHWLNDGGGYKDRLWDIYWAIENRSADFDWSKCLDVVNDKRRRWIIAAIGVTHRYLGLNVEQLPFKNELQQIPKWVFRAVEKEWADETRLLPLHYFLKDWKSLWKQIKKRIPPNPIQATIEVNGAFDNTPRIFYQIADTLKRSLPSWKRLGDEIKNLNRKVN